MSDPRIPDPRPLDPAMPHDPLHSPYRDPANDPRIASEVVQPSSGKGGLIAAGVIAVLLVVALIAFSTGPSTDPGTTAVIPDQTQETMPAPEAAPAVPDAGTEIAPAPAAPMDAAPPADQ